MSNGLEAGGYFFELLDGDLEGSEGCLWRVRMLLR